MRIFCFIILSLAPILLLGQGVIRGEVKTADTNQPLAFCSIALNHSDRGVISNEEGVFRISFDSPQDSLVISYLGYQTKIVSIQTLLRQPSIRLTRNEYELAEIIVRPNDAYLYQMIGRCRDQLKSVPAYAAKTYMEVNTVQDEQPMELVQCYFNGDFGGGVVQDLQLKTGRVGLARYKNHYFVSLGTSQAITRLNLLNRNNSFPVNPFQFKIKKLRKRYHLEELPTLEGDDLIHIKFTPKNNQSESFAGELWIDKPTNTLLKITCEIVGATVHPFELIRNLDKIDRVSFSLSQTFQLTGGQQRLTHFDFNYQLRYVSHEEQGAVKEINTKGLLYVYDYGQPFVLPFYNYSPEHHDYRKISFLPYQSFFWTRENPLELTKEQQGYLDYFWEKGELINFQESFFTEKEDRGFFRPTNLYWSKDRRISLKSSFPPEKTNSTADVSNLFRGDKYQLSVQLFLDINEVGDSIIHLSKTVFDIFKTYFYLEQEPLRECFINLYFDLCEVERRKMEAQIIALQPKTVEQIKEIYQRSATNLNAVTEQYIKEVQTGYDLEKLAEWNAVVMQALGIDNMNMFGLTNND